ncbi:MAG: PfkB family carbohydrate kinase [Magnetococcus sp. WYHC-3]
MSIQDKILPLDALGTRIRDLKTQGKRVAHCHGTFDLLHPGHLRHLERARREGDLLVVTLTADAYVNKGPGRPVFNENLRAESLAALAAVDWVGIVFDATALPAIEAIRPDAYIKGQDYKNASDDVTGNIARERAAVEKHGGSLVFTEEITFSSTSLLNQHFDVFPPATKDFLARFKASHPVQTTLDAIDSLRPMRVLVLGEAIIDEYCYSSPLGQTGKSGNILAVKYLSSEKFAGGSLAVANHLAGFCAHVTLVTGLGRNSADEAMLRERLLPNVEAVFFHFDQAPTLLKRRYLDTEMNKLFEVYHFEEQSVDAELDERMSRWLLTHAANYNVVVVPDYGNGLISDRMIDALTRSARFLAVNTQLNSGNRGYHVVTRYPRADFISLNEPEVRLAAHDKFSPLKTVAEQVARRVNAPRIAITRGIHGAMLMDLQHDQAFDVPALSTRVVDRIGAGDAFLSLAGLCLGGGLSPEMALFTGSAAAALDVQIVCNRESIQRGSLFKYITTLLK